MRLKDALERELQMPVRLRAGAPGSLIVLVNGAKIFSQKEAGHPPSPQELIALIRGS